MAIFSVPNVGLRVTGSVTLGMIESFLTLSKNFTNSISQISNQFHSIVTSLSGAEPIFKFMKEEPEEDNGYVTLVNAKELNETIVETSEHTGMWTRKHPKKDGSIRYTKLE